MKLRITKEWLEKCAALDDKAEVTTGSAPLEQLMQETNALRQTPYEKERLASAFGWLVRSRRLELRLSIEQLGREAKIDTVELLEIESNARHVAEPRTVHNLAGVLRLPPNRLMQLAGHLIPTDSGFTAEVERFAARARRIDTLTEEQHEVLREFVKYLAKHP